MKQPERLVTANQAGVHRRSGGGPGVHFDPDGEHFGRVRRQTDLVPQAREPYQGTVHRARVPNAQVDAVVLRCQLAWR